MPVHLLIPLLCCGLLGPQASAVFGAEPDPFPIVLVWTPVETVLNSLPYHLNKWHSNVSFNTVHTVAWPQAGVTGWKEERAALPPGPLPAGVHVAGSPQEPQQREIAIPLGPWFLVQQRFPGGEVKGQPEEPLLWVPFRAKQWGDPGVCTPSPAAGV